MKKPSLELLKDNVHNLCVSLEWLEYSHEQCVIIGIKDGYTKDEFDKFELELSVYINLLKLYFVQEKSIRNKSKLHKLHSESNKQIFNAACNEALYNKIILFLAVNKLDYLAYPLSDFFKALKKFCYLILPKNIVAIICEKRHKT